MMPLDIISEVILSSNRLHFQLTGCSHSNRDRALQSKAPVENVVDKVADHRDAVQNTNSRPGLPAPPHSGSRNALEMPPRWIPQGAFQQARQLPTY